MKIKNLVPQIGVVLLLVFSANTLAVVETYDFKTEAERKRYQVLVDELRCPKCQNQNLAGSNSPIAADLRRELYRMIEEGQDDQAIKSFMVKRYGNFVLYRPPLDTNTVLLWSLPAVMGFCALLIAFVFRVRLARVAQSQNLSEEEKKRLDDILNRYS